MNQSTLIEVITPQGEGMFHWKRMNRPFQIGSLMTFDCKNGTIRIQVQSSDQNTTTHQVSKTEWLKGHEFSIADDIKIRFKGKQYFANSKHGNNLNWNDQEIGKGGFFTAALIMALATQLIPKDDQKQKITEVEEIATIRLTTGESGLVAFSEPEKQPETIVAAEPPAGEIASNVAPAIEVQPVTAPAPAPVKKMAAGPKKIAPAPAAPVSPAPAPVSQAFSSKSGAKNQSGASVASAPAPNAAAILLSRRMASLQKGLQKVMTSPTQAGVTETSDNMGSNQIQGASQNTSSLVNSISTSEGSTGGSVYGGMKNQGAGIQVAGTRSLSGGNNFEIKKQGGHSTGTGTGTGIQLIQSSTPQVSGGELSVAVIQKTFMKNSQQLRNCYEAANITTASLKLNLEFTITPGGGVQGQKFLADANRQPASVEQKKLETCILRQMNNWKFETGTMKSNIVIEYPLTFRSLATGDE